MTQYIVENCSMFLSSELTWTTARQAAGEFTEAQLAELDLDDEINPKNYFNNHGVDIGWGEHGGDVYARAEEV